MNRRSIGAAYEKLAEDFLAKQGYQIIERNYYCRYGELDLIGEENGILCFIEVKYRKSSGSGYPQEAVGFRKQRSIRQCAGRYLLERGYRDETPCRFDVVGICPPDLWLIRDAFGGL